MKRGRFLGALMALPLVPEALDIKAPADPEMGWRIGESRGAPHTWLTSGGMAMRDEACLSRREQVAILFDSARDRYIRAIERDSDKAEDWDRYVGSNGRIRLAIVTWVTYHD